MLRFYKGDPNAHIVVYRGGRAIKGGAGLSFFYMPMFDSVARVPTVDCDSTFVIRETTSDYQEVAVQGSLTYRISDPDKAGSRLDFTIDPNTGAYRADDPSKLVERIANAVQLHARGTIRSLALEDALKSSESLVQATRAALAAEPSLSALGVSVEGVFITSIRAQPEVQKALEAPYREEVNRRADTAIFERRSAALEQERRIKRTELETEIDSEEKRKELVELQSANELLEAKADAAADELRLKPLASLSPQLIMALGLKEFANNPSKIGSLNITPELVSQLTGLLKTSREDDN